MNTINGLWVRIALRAAVVSLILGIATRIWSHYNNVYPARLDALFGITADAMLRFTDTCLLFAIGLGVYFLLTGQSNVDKK